MTVEFYGRDLDIDTAETLLFTRWKDADRKRELSLFASKDWDERAEHPVISTYHFCHIFTEEVRLLIRAHVDNTPARVTRSGKIIDWFPIKSGDPLDPPDSDIQTVKWRRKLNSIIRARQWADTHGIPYRFMIRTALKKIYFGRYYLLQRTTLPDPGLLNGEQMRQEILLAWVEQLETKIQHGTHSRYLVSSTPKHPDLFKHQCWIMQQIKRRSQPQYALSNFIRMDLLDPNAVALAFPKHIDKALKLSA